MSFINSLVGIFLYGMLMQHQKLTVFFKDALQKTAYTLPG